MPDEINWDSLTRQPTPRDLTAGGDLAQPRDDGAPATPGRWQKVLGPIAAIGAGLFKFALPIVKFLPLIFKGGGGMLLSLLAYAWLYGWRFGIGALLLLFIHEMGHSIAAKAFGLRVSAPVFIPFMGAVILLRDMPKNAWVEAVVGFSGPLLGTLGGLVCYSIGLATGNPLFIALASWAFFLNLFNLVPVVPLDGGRVVSAISPWLWLVGLALLVPFLLWNLSLGGVWILMLVATSLPRVWRLFRAPANDPSRRYFECEPWQRAAVSAGYFGLVLFLAFSMTQTHQILAQYPIMGAQ